MNRRGFLTGIIAACVAPAIIKTPGLLMPIKPALVTTPWEVWEYHGPIDQMDFIAIVHPLQERWLRDIEQYTGRYAVSRPLPKFEKVMS